MELTCMWGPEPSYAPGQISSETGFQCVAPPRSPQGQQAPHRGAPATPGRLGEGNGPELASQAAHGFSWRAPGAALCSVLETLVP